MKSIEGYLLLKTEKAEDFFDTKLLRKVIKEYNQRRKKMKEELPLWVVYDYPAHPYIAVYQTDPFELLFITSLKELEELAFGC